MNPTATSFFDEFKPLHDNLVVKQMITEGLSEGGIIIPDPAREKLNQGTVISAGPGTWRGDQMIPMSVKVGDLVAFTPYAGTSLTLGGETVLIMKEEQILGVLPAKKRRSVPGYPGAEHTSSQPDT